MSLGRTNYILDCFSGRLLYRVAWSDDVTEGSFYSPSKKFIKTLSISEALEEIWKLTGEEEIWVCNSLYTRNSSGVWEKPW